MPRACVVCKEKRSPSGVTLHRIPKDTTLLQKWVDQINPRVRLSTKSLLCSKHFEKSCFRTKSNGHKVLLPDSYPTIFESSEEVSQESILNASNELLQDADSSRGSKRRFFSGDFAVDDMKDPELAKKFFEIVHSERKTLIREKRNLKRKNDRLEQKITSITTVLEECLGEKMLSKSTLDTLKFSMTSAVAALLRRVAEDSTNKSYPAELRSFVSTLNLYSGRAYEYVNKLYDFILYEDESVDDETEIQDERKENFDKLEEII